MLTHYFQENEDCLCGFRDRACLPNIFLSSLSAESLVLVNVMDAHKIHASQPPLQPGRVVLLNSSPQHANGKALGKCPKKDYDFSTPPSPCKLECKLTLGLGCPSLSQDWKPPCSERQRGKRKGAGLSADLDAAPFPTVSPSRLLTSDFLHRRWK